MGVPSNISHFDSKFWIDKLRELDYPLKVIELDLSALKEQRALPSDSNPCRVSKLYSDDYVEIALVEFESTDKLRRSFCTKAARSWKANRLIKPLLCFTNGTDGFAVIVPGKGVGGEAKVLGLSDKLYRTDRDVLESMEYPGDSERLNKCYDTVFFPYQKVRDEFFEGYRNLYQQVEKAVRKILKSESTSYAQRFLGRLMFLYFLQKKGWLKGNKQFIDTIKDYKELNKLFYESLNREGTPGLPFLNGSLFEREGYMNTEMQDRLHPKLDELFKNARRFFNDYNFTVDETSPLEVEVSIDPALIGTVFENMLPGYERGSKGTFYTPRVETSFICRRALTNFLGLNDEFSPDGKTFHDGFSRYMERLKKTKSEKDVRRFRERLLSLRILDPAVGSGGFLLVMMQEIIALIQEAEASVGWKSDVEQYKKRILPNLYGFDIEPEAIEIACLRLWLSLIIDQKEPEPLPNLDMNIIAISDSLRLPNFQRTLDVKVEELRERFTEVKAKYLNEHKAKNKKRLKEQLQEISDKIAKRTGVDPNVIEAHMPKRADIIVMNPPYVRQESISKGKKDYYVKKYLLSRKADLYTYFLVRTLNLLPGNGVASVISSDKWLETNYGLSIQKKLKASLIAIYTQRERTFGADINTVITVYGNRKKTTPVHFTYLESYGGKEVRQHITISRNDLVPGKWFYLRPAKLFLEKILPKMTHKLGDLADIRFGNKTGANKFFCVNDVSFLYEADYLSNPKKFENWGVKAATRADLEKQGLIYIENEGGERFVIDKKDVTPIVRSPKELRAYIIQSVASLLFKPVPANKPGSYSMKYIKWGEKCDVIVGKGRKKGAVVKGYNSLTTVKSHRPFWFNVPDLTPSHVIPNRFIHERHFTSMAKTEVLASDACALAYPKHYRPINLWIYMNSTIFYLTEELYGMRMGGGALEMLAGEYRNLPAFDIRALRITDDLTSLLDREPLEYSLEIETKQRRKIDLFILKAMGFNDPEKLLDELYVTFVDAVEDRLVKGGRPLKKMAKTRNLRGDESD